MQFEKWTIGFIVEHCPNKKNTIEGE